VTPDQLHNLATAAGAMVLGDPGTRQQYMLDLVQLARLVDLADMNRQIEQLKATLPALPKINAD
jgi:hypothetical protein